jgi:hypothetical protein
MFQAFATVSHIDNIGCVHSCAMRRNRNAKDNCCHVLLSRTASARLKTIITRLGGEKVDFNSTFTDGASFNMVSLLIRIGLRKHKFEIWKLEFSSNILPSKHTSIVCVETRKFQPIVPITMENPKSNI